MILCTHDSMTYLKPSNLFGKIFRWTAKCQNKDYKEQFDLGVRCFDLRLKWKFPWSKTPIFAHGLINYSSVPVIEVLKFLQEKQKETGEKIYIRFMLETFFKSSKREQKVFKYYIDYVHRNFPELTIKSMIKNPWTTIEDNFGLDFIELQQVPTWKTILLGPRILAIKYQKDLKDYKDSKNIIAGDFIV